MKKAIITFILVSAIACGSPATENKPAATANQPAANSVRNAATANTNTAPADSLPSIKVSTPSDHKFSKQGIPEGWSWIDADASTGKEIKFDTSGGTLKFAVPQGRDMYGDNRTAPHMLRTIEGDFQIETRVRFDPREDYQGAGLFIYVDGNNYVRLERAFGGVDGGGSGIRLDARTEGDYRSVTPPSDVPTSAGSVDLKLLRTGNIVYAFWRADENREWKEIGDVEYNFPATVRAGIIACNTAAVIPVEFVYIKLAPAVSGG